jgi:EmrB/QacA subfamily drug resistance transporter
MTTGLMAPPRDVPQGRNWGVLAVVLVGAFMALLDTAIVNVAVPSIRSDLHVSFGGAELVVTAYTITYACLLITGGRLGDMLGRKRLFIAGIVVFTAASALCGVAPSAGVLIAARAIQGVGGALLYPQVLSVIQVTFTGQALAKALGVFGSVIGIAVVSGQVVGGLLISANISGWDWRPIFLVNVPIGIIGLAAAVIVLPRDHHRDPGERQRTLLDAGGVVLAALFLFCLVVPLLAGRDDGWPAWMIGCLAAALPVLGLFLSWERRLERRGGAPLVRLRLFAERGFAAGVPMACLFMLAYGGFVFVLSVYLQSGLGFTPLRAGLTASPSAVAFFLASLAAPRLVPLLGRSLLSLGYGLAALGILGTSAVAAAAGGHLAPLELTPVLFVTGLGLGLGLTPLVGAIVAGLKPADAGAASGVITTAMQSGNALGVAVLTLVFFSILSPATGAAQAADAFADALPICAAAFVAAAILVRWLPRGPRFANALIEQQPGWAYGFAYSTFLMTGGRIGDRLFEEILGKVTSRRGQRVEEAPADPGDFLVYQFTANEADRPWLNYLVREALAFGSRPVSHEESRTPVIQRQVEEIRDRQAAGTIDPDLDPAAVRLLAFALASYPRILPQITRMATGLDADDPRFTQQWDDLLRTVGDRALGGRAPVHGSPEPAEAAPRDDAASAG